MKKLILSAVFALACFTAQAKNEVVSNDDKNPKNKVKKEIKAKKPELTTCRVTVRQTLICNGVSTVVTSSGWSDIGCAVAYAAAMYYNSCD